MSKTLIAARYPHPKFPRLSVQMRSNSRFYQAVTFIDGKLVQWSTKTPDLPLALKLSEDWYRRTCRASATFGNAHPFAKLTNDPTLAELFTSYCATQEPRKQAYARMRWSPIAPFWRARLLSTVNTGTFKEFFAWRRRQSSVKNITLHKDVTVIRQILNYAIDQELLPQLPRIPSVGTIETNPRPWFTPVEWERLGYVAGLRIMEAPNKLVQQRRKDALEFMNFLKASMLRVDELRTLRFDACRIETNTDGDQLLLCEVTGKRGTHTAVADGTAAFIYEQRRQKAQPTDLIFPHHCRNTFRELLIAADLRENAQGFQRNLRSVRVTSISHKLLDQPELNLVTVARNAHTSLQMIDHFYAKRLTPELKKHELSRLRKEVSDNLKTVKAAAKG
jgi:hypothetical protein